jgi:hypothetical protein
VNGSTGTGTLLLYGDSAATIPLTISDTGAVSTTGKVTIGNASLHEQMIVNGYGSANGAALRVNDGNAAAIGMYAPYPTIMWYETDTVDQNWMARLDAGVLQFGTQNDAISIFSAKISFSQGNSG